METQETQAEQNARLDIKCEDSKLRRDELTRDGWCLNGKTHGKATHGRRCGWCAAVHKHGVLKVLADPNAPQKPPGYTYRPRRDQRPLRTVYVTPPL